MDKQCAYRSDRVRKRAKFRRLGKAQPPVISDGFCEVMNSRRRGYMKFRV